MKDKKIFGSFIKEKRIEKGYSQKDLAEILFVTESAVSKWERGITYPDITLITDICKALDITEHELIESSNDQEYHKIEKDARKFNKIKKTLFWCFNITYAIALLVCFIVNLAVDHKLSWFFIVLTSIMTAYSFCPTITFLFNSYKKIVFISSTFISLFLLFLTCSIYTKNYWFLIPTVSVLLGYFIIFYPILYFMQKKYIVDEKFNNLKRFFLISYVLGMMILLILLLLSIHWYIPFKIGFAITLVVLLFVIPIMYGLVCLFEKNNILLKIFTFCLVGIISLGFIVSLFNSIYLETTEVMECYYFDNNYSDIKIQGSDFDIKIYQSITEENKVECIENKKINFDVQIINNKLTIKQIDNRNIFDSLFNFSNLEIQLHLSNETINKLFIDNNTGDITIGNSLVFNDIEINSSTSDVYIESKDVNNIDVKLSTGSTIIKNCLVNKNIIVESSTGNIELENVNCEKLDITVSTGDVILTNVLVADDFNMNGSTSDLTFTDFDASNIYINVSTGDVNGTILTSKIFMPNSSAGDVDVPETTTGGICKIETSTGNIRIKIK